MDKLKLIAVGMVILGLISFIGGVIIPMKELAEYGLYIVVVGIMGYAIMFIIGSTNKSGTEKNL